MKRTFFLIFFCFFQHFVTSLFAFPPGVSSGDKYAWEKNKEEFLDIKDLVLIYAGTDRVPRWGKEQISTYVSYKDKKGKEHWLFDGFLFLEILNEGKAFTSARKISAGNKEDWTKLVDNFFHPEFGVGALEKCIDEVIARIGAPQEKRRLVIGIPEPIKNEEDPRYWGAVNKNELLDFSRDEDRIIACKWYIDYVRESFEKMNVKNIELSGFYWITEAATTALPILSELGEYLKSFKYTFVWIPYFESPAYERWKELGFTHCYMQPNYYIRDRTPYEQLKKVSKIAKEHDMDLEMEFDDRVLLRRGWGYKLRDYMEVFRKNGVWANNRLAYYQGHRTLQKLSTSSVSYERELYHDFCGFVIERPIRQQK